MFHAFKRKDKLLRIAAIITLCMASANALEYFFAGKKYLRVKTGVLENVTHDRYTGSRGELYSRTRIYLEGTSRKFSISDNAMEGGYVEVEKGDTITLYTRKWYQLFYNFDLSNNIYYVEKNGEMIYNNLGDWKAPAFFYMFVEAICSLLLWFMYRSEAKSYKKAARLKRFNEEFKERRIID